MVSHLDLRAQARVSFAVQCEVAPWSLNHHITTLVLPQFHSL